MTKDYFKRLSAIDYTAWDLNCRTIVPHTPRKNKTERIIKRKVRRGDKLFLKKVLDNEL
jgi:hypothetical protein